MNNDLIIARMLRRLLLRDEEVPSRLIQVTVEDGYVTLRGHVRTSQALEKAGQIARSLPGVRSVRNELEVVPPRALSDAFVAECVRKSLESDSRVVKESITVSVVNGVATLTGTVRGNEERILALDIALSCEGIRCVEHALRIDVVRGIDDATLARRVMQAIGAAISDREGRVRIAISEGRGVLSGWVRCVALKCVAEDLAREFRLNDLKNEIQVLPEAG